MNLIYLLVPIALLVFSVVFSIVLVKRGTSAKRAMAIHFLSLIVIATICIMLPIGASASEADTNEAIVILRALARRISVSS